MIWLSESFVNKTENYRYGDAPAFEAFTDDVGVLFKGLQKEYGRCTSKVYRGAGDAVGWVFEKWVKYDDSPKKYLRETWVTLYESEPVQPPMIYEYKIIEAA